MPQHISDTDLVAQLKSPATRRAAFEHVVRKYQSKLYWQIRHVVTFHDDADDVLQNTFVKAWSAVDSFRGEAHLSTWLYRIAVNESLAFLQQRRDNIALDAPEASIARQLESDPYFDGDETELLLQQALQTLPPKQLQVFTLKYFDGLKYEEMAEILQTSVGALKASYHISVKKIRFFFDAHD